MVVNEGDVIFTVYTFVENHGQVLLGVVEATKHTEHLINDLNEDSPRQATGYLRGLKQFELYIMKLFIVPTISLFLYILADNIFIAAFAYCIYVVSIGPKFSTPQILFD